MVELLKSTIRAVTVYSRGALVTREAQLSFDGGDVPERVRIPGLPLAADDSSFRVQIESPDATTAAAVDLRVMLDVPNLDDALSPADDAELLELRRREAELHDRGAQLKRELARLAKLTPLPRAKHGDSGEPVPSPLASRLALLEYRLEQEESLTKEHREVQESLRKARERRIELEDREKRRSTARAAREHELRKTAVIRLATTEKKISGTLILQYLVPGARWAPSYSVSIERDPDEAELSMRAVVVQKTGEDWTGVDLVLSTAEAHHFADAPELASLRIGPRKSQPRQIGWREPPAGTDDLFEAYDAAFASPPPSQPSYAEEPVEALADDDDTYVPELDEVTREVDLNRLAREDDVTLVVPSAMVSPARQSRGKGRKRGEERAGRPTQRISEVEASFLSGGPPPPAPSGALVSALVPEEPMVEQPWLTASGDFLDYGRLRMPAPDQATRGRLQPIPLVERYLELLQSSAIPAEFDVEATVREAEMRARELEYLDPPSRCTFAWSNRFDYAFRAGTVVTIPADGRYHSVPVTRARTKAKISYVSVPREQAEVFRVATLHNPLRAPILAGPVDVYIDSNYVTTSDLEVKPRGAQIELGLGVEQQIKVARNTRFGADSSGLLGQGRSLRHEIRIDVENLLTRDVDLEVRERLPVVDDDEEDIKVVVGKVSPDWTSYEPFPNHPMDEPLRGGHRWNLRVKARDKSELRVHYEIKISSKHELVGGNRRE